MFIENIMKDDKIIAVDHTVGNDKYAKDHTEKVNQLKNGVINASTLKLGKQDKEESLSEQKKQSFKKQAQSIIEGAIKKRMEKLTDLEEMQAHCKTLEEECQEETNQLNDLKDSRTALMEEYGIEADSDEEKELKFKESVLFGTKGGDKLEEKITAGFTDYQKRAFEIDKMSKICSDRLDSKQNELYSYHRAIIEIKIDDAKDNSMLEAYRDLKELLKKGNKEIINQIVKEAVEEKQEELEEQQKEIKEEKEENIQEEKGQIQGKLDNETEKQKASMEEDILTSQISHDKIQQKILKAAQESNLYYEDIKGITVDDQI